MESRCEECRWYSLGGFCLLGRNIDQCDSPRARRGDDGLAVRLLDAYKEGKIQEEKLRGALKEEKKK